MKNARLNMRIDPILLDKIRSEADKRKMTVTHFITQSVENQLKPNLTEDEKQFFNYEPDNQVHQVCKSPND